MKDSGNPATAGPPGVRALRRPGPAILAAAAVILAGIAIAQLGKRRRPELMVPADGIEAEGKVAFKGV